MKNFFVFIALISTNILLGNTPLQKAWEVLDNKDRAKALNEKTTEGEAAISLILLNSFERNDVPNLDLMVVSFQFDVKRVKFVNKKR